MNSSRKKYTQYIDIIYFVFSRFYVSFYDTGTNNSGAAVDSVWMHGVVRGAAVSILPGNIGNQTSGHGVGGGEYR